MKCIVLALAICWSYQACAKYLAISQISDAQIIAKQQSSPYFDFSENAEITAFLARKKIYLSLTTIPSRVDTLGKTLSTIDSTHIEKIFLTLPKFDWEGNALNYDLPSDLEHLEKLQILRPHLDLGPISKLVPSLEFLKQYDPNSYLITIDDDVAYPFGFINEFINHFYQYPNHVIAASIPHITGWTGNDPWLWPYRRPQGDVVEGFAGVGYPVWKMDTQLMKYLASLNIFSRLSDDVVISYVLAASNIDIKRLNTKYHNVDMIWSFAFGHREDALHRGRGLGVLLNDVNPYKYSKTLNSIYYSSEGLPLRLLKSRIPYDDKRRKSLFITLNLLMQRNAKNMVETGTSRFGQDGCLSDGCSTLIFSDFAAQNAADFLSIDIDYNHIENAKKSLKDGKVKFIESDSLTYLQSRNDPIDFLYLDSLDFDPAYPELSQKHQLNEIKSAFRLLHDKSVILLDDCGLPMEGKCRLSGEFLLKQGWKKFVDEYQTVWLKR